MAKYLVTGGCGFIGSHLVENLLRDRHQVIILDDLSTGKRENIPSHCEIIVGDVADKHTVHKCMQGVDGCFHLAAIASVQESNENWIRTHQVNLSGTINVFEAARKNKTPVVYASSAAVYGDNADIPLKESSAVSPMTAYGADKLGSEQHARVATLVHGIPTTGLRFFNIYGKRQDPSSPYSGVISIFMDRINKGLSIRVYGDGMQTRDFIYVEDVVQYLRKSMKEIGNHPKVFNVCTGNSVTVNQLAQTIMSITGLQGNIEYCPSRKGDIRGSVGDPFFAKQKLNISARYSLIEGLRDLLDHKKHNQCRMKLVAS
jgi:UDP-glucose 4-epimerase